MFANASDRKKKHSKWIIKFGYITSISAACSFIVFLTSLFFYSQTAQIITFILTIGFSLGVVFDRLHKKHLTRVYMTTVPPLMLGSIIILVGGFFGQDLIMATSAFMSFIIFRKHPQLRKIIIAFNVLIFILPTLYINIYGPLLEPIDLPFDEIIVFLVCLGWLSITFFMYDEKKTRSYTTELELKNKSLKANALELKKSQESLKSQNKELALLNQELELKNKQIEEFTYMVTHDLKAPISNIDTITDQLKSHFKNSSSPEVDTYFNYLKASSSRMMLLVDNLLENAKIGNSKVKESVDLNNLLNDILKDLSHRTKETKAIINIDNLPVVQGYPIELGLLFQNLLDNALKFVPKNKNPEINITCYKKADSYLFTVSDNGIGIPKKHFDKIFKAFQKLHASKEFEGSGIGLYGCKKVVEYHGGRIWVESTENKGSTFYFTLPLK
ncbi:GHKL domain-containing protein [Maribacter sp. MMG018]|uniref:sensor histidine kinase n=1 Tax=Maribacter sp. MMG018 TaxID=2822688 RepID=UPI001B362A80|nr:ATP-binding protein [Maribacter sp. MMG018]MBQ4914480.1 GHKL domain-containing protein [Maribacter sp. MMG018]